MGLSFRLKYFLAEKSKTVNGTIEEILMITNKGKEVIAKYLIGQAPAYASYIAIGCGAKPLPTNEVLGDYSNKKSLDFEMFRVPIISRGFVNEDDVAKIVLTAELPTADRYEISEIGVFSARANSLASNSDSRSLYSFSSNEGWAYHSAEDNSVIPIPPITAKLDNGTDTNDIVDEVITIPGSQETYNAFEAAASNSIFLSDRRTERFEQPRFLDNAIFMSGSSAKLDVTSNGAMSVDSEWTNGDTFKSSHIHLTSARLNFDNNAVTDELRLAFSVVSKDEDSVAVPSNVRVMIEFTSNDTYDEGQYARLEVDLYDTNATINVANDPISRKNVTVSDLSLNRYFVINKKMQDLTKSPGFSWEIVKNVKVYVSVLGSDANPTGLYYVCLDGLRFENISTPNPLYGMTGYTVVTNNINDQPRTIIKSPNSTNYVEFRFEVDV
jgi:hypothetical protein